MSTKRPLADLDPDYEDIAEQQWKKQKLLQDDAKELTVKKIERIIQKHFDVEIQYKESEVKLIDQRLNEARHVLDRLRACIVANYYSGAGQLTGQIKLNPNQPPVIHPAVKKYLGKSVRHTGSETGTENTSRVSSQIKHVGNEENNHVRPVQPLTSTSSEPSNTNSVNRSHDCCHPRYKVKKRIVVGNVSKYIPADKRDSNDRATHKWMVYVRGPRDTPNIDHFVKKVWFFLHPSYRPNDLVEVCHSPFHLTRRGWGEFPVRVQLHFADSRNKRVDIIHHLKLDKTYTGLQTLGSETHVDIELDRATLLEETLPLKPSQTSHYRAPSGENGITHGEQRSEENNKTEHNTSGSELIDVKQETESENSLGVVWSPASSHDHAKSHDLNADLQLDIFGEENITSDQGILGNTELGNLSDELGIMGNGKSDLVNEDVLLSSKTCDDLEMIKNASGGSTEIEHRSLDIPEGHVQSVARSQTSQSAAAEGCTRPEIKQEDGHQDINLGDNSLTTKTTEIKDEPIDDAYPGVSSGYLKPSPGRVKNIGFQPITADGSQPGAGWMHVQIKSEPIVSDRPSSTSSGRTDRTSMLTTPERESQPSVPSSPATPDRSVLFDVGHPGSAGIKCNVSSTTGLFGTQQQDMVQTTQDSATDFLSWKQMQATPGGGLRKHTLTLGVGVGQLSSGVQSQVASTLAGQLATSKATQSQENTTSTVTKSSCVTTMTTSVSSTSNTGRTSELMTSVLNTSIPAKQSNAVDTVYIQCVDTSGKVYLIPQQMLKTSSAIDSKLSLKPPATSPGRKDILKTTIVGSGPNKATLTYMLSSQAPKPAKVLTSQASRTAAPLMPVSMPAGGAAAQKLVFIPGVGSSSHQVAVVQPAKQKEAGMPSMPLQLGTSVKQPHPMLIRDQSGNMQIVQMVPPASLVQKLSPHGSSSMVVTNKMPASIGKTMKSGIRMSAGEKVGFSPPAPLKATMATIPDSALCGSTQNSPVRSLVISKDTFGQLQSGQLLQIDIPQSRTSPTKLDTCQTDVVGQASSRMVLGVAGSDVAGQPAGRSETRRVASVAHPGVSGSKPQGSISLLRPGLIGGKLNVPGLARGKIPPGGATGSRVTSPGLVKSSLLALNTSPLSSTVHTPTTSTQEGPTLTGSGAVKRAEGSSLIGQSLLKSASTGSLTSLQQKDSSAFGLKSGPLYLSTKIGNQTVLLKIDDLDTKKALTNDLMLASGKPSVDLGTTVAPAVMADRLTHSRSSSALNAGQKGAALAGVGALITPTIKQGSILGLHKAKEVAKPEHFEINLPRFGDFESLLTFVVRRFPLIGEHIDRSVHPYSAHSQSQFLDWNVGKRRAAEWQRASRVRKRILSSLHGEGTFRGSRVWSTKEIQTWCRQHLYTPLDKALVARYNAPQQQINKFKVTASHPPGGFSSYTDHKRTLTTLCALSKSPGGSSEDEEIDIVGIDRPTKDVIKKEVLEADDDDVDVNKAEIKPLYGVAQYIHQVAEQIGVNFEPVHVKLDNGSSVLMSLSEEVLLSALRSLIDGVIRKAVSLRHHTERFTDEVSAKDVYNALEVLEKNDFLLNRQLGTPLLDSCVTDDTGSNM